MKKHWSKIRQKVPLYNEKSNNDEIKKIFKSKVNQKLLKAVKKDETRIRKQVLRRPKMSIDKETEFTEDNIKDIKSARKNKEIFMMNYAIEF